MYTIDTVIYSYLMGAISSLSAGYILLKRQRISRMYFYYIERLKLPMPFTMEKVHERTLYWLPVFLTTFVTIGLFSFKASPGNSYYDISSLNYIGSYLPSVNIKPGMTSPALWFVSLISGFGMTYLNHFFSWRAFNSLPEKMRSLRTWVLVNMLLSIILSIFLGSFLGVLLFETSFWTNVAAGFGIVTFCVLVNFFAGHKKSE